MTPDVNGERGFSLVEIALVLLVLGVMMRAVLVPLGSVQELRNHRAVKAQVQQIRESLFAHIVAYGALPCPAALSTAPGSVAERSVTAPTSDKSVPRDSLEGIGNCKRYEGGVPARILGLGGATSTTQALLDPWGREYIFAVSSGSGDDDARADQGYWTTPGEASRLGISSLDANLVVCARSGSAACSSTYLRADQIVFVVVSTGGDSSAAGHQIENLDGDTEYALLPESIDAAAPFDDHLVWGTVADAVYHMLKSGWLP